MTTKAHTTVADLMTREPESVSPDTTMRQLAHLFEEHEVSGFPVVDDAGRLVGVVSQTDLIRRCLSPIGGEAPGFFFQELAEQLGEEAEMEPDSLIVVADIMTTEVVTAHADEPLSVIAKRMCDRHVHRVVVVNDRGSPIGIVTTMDMLRAMAR